MMAPAVALLGFGPGRWWLPIPVILLWPPVLLALVGVGLVELAFGRVTLQISRTLGLALWQLHGVRIDVQSSNGGRVLLWLL
jgi:hypothetical protein